MNHPLPPARPRQKYTDDGLRMREVLSYSRRGGRFTPSQQESWDAHHRDWVIPDEAVDDPSFSWAEAFGREAPVIVEIGSGIGEATAALAAGRPSYDVVALEVWRPGVAHTLGLLAEAGADNVRLLSVDAVWCLEHLFGAGRGRGALDLLPRPVAQDAAPQASSGHRRASPAWRPPGCVRAGCGGWRPTGPTTPSRWPGARRRAGARGGRSRWADRPVTKFERKGLAAGRQIVDLAYRRRAAPGWTSPDS